MKCVKNRTGAIYRRLPDKQAARKVKVWEWEYCSKSEYRKAVRENNTTRINLLNKI